MSRMRADDERFLRLAISVARESREHGNHPFGALLVDPRGEALLAAENSVVTQRDATGHAELNLVRAATPKYTAEQLKDCTLYSSSEPCPMCAGAIVWSNVRRVVFGFGMDALYAMMGADAPGMRLRARAVFEKATSAIEVVGPALEEEARAVHEGFWSS
jgi:tRNA(Arg) A34 adenosine deaminase TadA